MDEKILAIYDLCADFLQALGHAEEPQQQMSDAEVVTTALMVVLFFGGSFERRGPCWEHLGIRHTCSAGVA
jgi:hypothetical protein